VRGAERKAPVDSEVFRAKKSSTQLYLVTPSQHGDQGGIAASYNNIGHIYFSKGNHVKALEYYSTALDLWMRIFKDETHPYITIVRRNILRVEEALTYAEPSTVSSLF
jgi:hypothetical protein